METLAAQPQTEQQFDRYRRTYNDATTWLAEMLDGSMRTPFEYHFDGQELYAEDGSRMGKIFADSLVSAERMAARNPQLAFEARRCRLERGEYEDMLAMARGDLPNTMIVESDFPPELLGATRDVGGYNVGRKQTMQRVITWDGQRMRMYSQSLDGSDRQALEAIYAEFGRTPAPGELLGQRIHVQLPPEEQEFLTDRLTGVYDRSMQRQYGGRWCAGRREERHDTYAFVLSQHDLVDRFVGSRLRGTMSQRERYDIAALLQKRFDQFKQPFIATTEPEVVLRAFGRSLDFELRAAGNEARAAGVTFSGCGVSSGPGGEGGSAEGQLRQAGYGNKIVSDKYGSLKFYCPNGHPNERPYRKLIPRCVTCGVSVKC